MYNKFIINLLNIYIYREYNMRPDLLSISCQTKPYVDQDWTFKSRDLSSVQLFTNAKQT